MPSDQSSDGTDWKFEKGETLIEQQETPQMDDLDNFRDVPREYTVKRRLYDADADKRLYYLEWERETAGGPSTENQLYDAGLVRMQYRSIDTDTNSEGGESGGE
ncbi:hypothetical protein NDI85_21375 [Halomicroarcula sp. S1AR25-4]|uniref:hypothetical protein n=1 Tax=Haloarcula sp. S1AR25-4 TaxID=2950538 RepID=UPI002876EB76|nr:hypothetical protein [Halomicroarcula sp. S1AR25-4]MDS0280340.1 hypothetical protein [Halomicroarcula sp. S1AR25-4]